MQRQWSAWIFPYLFGFTVHNIELGAPPSTMYNIISCLGMNTLLHIDSSAHMYRVHLVARNHRQLSLTKRGPKIMKLRSKLYSETDRISWVNTFCLYIERLYNTAASTFIYETNSLYCHRMDVLGSTICQRHNKIRRVFDATQQVGWTARVKLNCEGEMNIGTTYPISLLDTSESDWTRALYVLVVEDAMPSTVGGRARLQCMFCII